MCNIIYSIFISIEKKKNYCSQVFFFSYGMSAFVVLKWVKKNSTRGLHTKRKWDNESDISQSTGTLWLFFLLDWEVNFKLFFSIARNKTWNRSQKWINTIIQQSVYAKEKNTRRLRVRAGMQKKKRSYILKGALKTKCWWLQVFMFASYGNWWKASLWQNMVERLDWNEGTTRCYVKWTGVLSVCWQTTSMKLFLWIAITYCVINLLYSS